MKIKHIEAKQTNIEHLVIRIVAEGSIKDLEKVLDESKQKDYEVSFKQMRKKRSLTQNAYYNELLDKLQYSLMKSGLPISREDLHERMLADYGVTQTWEDGRPMLIPLTPEQNAHQMGLHAQILNPGELNGKPCVWWRVVKGSSKMNTSEMSQLIDGLIAECKELGIDTKPSAPLGDHEDNNKRSTEN